MSQTITVSQLNRYVSAILEKDPHLNPVMIKGEISGFRAYPSGHLYFTLKDEKAAVSCVMFKGQTKRLRFRPENGNQVIVTARAALYDRDGRFQLYVSDMVSDGMGDLHLAFEQMKEKLSREGLFAEDRKKPIPVLPTAIGVVTSEAGAVIRDIIQVLGRRFPNFRLKLIPVPVQGDEAAPAIAQAIACFNQREDVDVIIVGRGGGSMEDLWAFNEEIVARAVAASKIPVVSAVGHETDYTICDFVADLRAPTPSAAAELVMPVRQDLLLDLKNHEQRLTKSLVNKVASERRQIHFLAHSQVFRRPLERVESKRLDLDHQTQRLQQQLSKQLTSRQHQLALLSHKLDALSPLKVLSRGYGLVKTVPENKTILSSQTVKTGDKIDVWLSDGVLGCKVETIRGREV